MKKKSSKKAAKKRKSPVGLNNTFIYRDKASTSACARFGYRYPIEIVRAFEELEMAQENQNSSIPHTVKMLLMTKETHDFSQLEELKMIICDSQERDHLTDSIITAIRDISVLSLIHI